MNNIADFTRYNKVQFTQFFTYLREILSHAEIEKLQIDHQLNEVYKYHNLLLKEFKNTDINELTLALKKEDDKRNNCCKGILQVLNGYKLREKQQIQEASERLLSVFYKHGTRIYRLPYSEKTSIFRKIYKDLTAQFKDDLSLLNLTEWLNDLNDHNLKFETLFIERIEQKALKTISKPVLRKSLVVAFKEFYKYLQAINLITPSPEGSHLIDSIHSLIQKTNLDNAKRKRFKTSTLDLQEDLRDL